MRTLRHTYIREGDAYPRCEDGRPLLTSMIFHIAGRDEDTGLDIWWWYYED